MCSSKAETLKSPFLAGSQNSRGPISLPRELLLHDRIIEMSRMPEKKSHNDWLSFEARAVKSIKDWSETVNRNIETPL